jgi:ribosomal protein eS8
MGITRESRHKRRETGGKRPKYRKKRKHELGRPAAMTKLGAKRVHPVRCRGGNLKFRGIRLETGNYSWGSEVCTRKVRILDVVYNASNNELVRTKTLVKGAIVQVDATYAAALPKAGDAQQHRQGGVCELRVGLLRVGEAGRLRGPPCPPMLALRGAAGVCGRQQGGGTGGATEVLRRAPVLPPPAPGRPESGRRVGPVGAA